MSTQEVDVLSLKVTTAGSAAGIVLPTEIMSHLKVQDGDTLYLTEAPDGSYRLTSRDPAIDRQMGLAEKIMEEDREILRALAK